MRERVREILGVYHDVYQKCIMTYIRSIIYLY